MMPAPNDEAIRAGLAEPWNYCSRHGYEWSPEGTIAGCYRTVIFDVRYPPPSANGIAETSAGIIGELVGRGYEVCAFGWRSRIPRHFWWLIALVKPPTDVLFSDDAWAGYLYGGPQQPV